MKRQTKTFPSFNQLIKESNSHISFFPSYFRRHIVVVLDAKSGRFELYVDGKLDGFVEGAIKYNVLASRILSNFIVGCQFVDDGQKSPSGGLTR